MHDRALIIPIPRWRATHLQIIPKGRAYRTLATSKCIGPNDFPEAGQPTRIRNDMLDRAIKIANGQATQLQHMTGPNDPQMAGHPNNH